MVSHHQLLGPTTSKRRDGSPPYIWAVSIGMSEPGATMSPPDQVPKRRSWNTGMSWSWLVGGGVAAAAWPAPAASRARIAASRPAISRVLDFSIVGLLSRFVSSGGRSRHERPAARLMRLVPRAPQVLDLLNSCPDGY